MTQKFSLRSLACIISITIFFSACNSNTNDKVSTYAENLYKEEIIKDVDINGSSFIGTVIKSTSFVPDDYNKNYVQTEMVGGDSSDKIANTISQAYAQPMNTLNINDTNFHLDGDANFETVFRNTVESAVFQSGLGPVQNHIKCDSCHQSDGRATLPYVPHKNFNDTMFEDNDGYHKLRHSGVFLRISIENEDINSASKTKDNMWGSPIAVPNFSDQLHHRGSTGARDSEDGLGAGLADVWMKYKTKIVTYPDGSTVELSKPLFFVDNPYDAPDSPDNYNSIDFSADSKSRLFRADVKMGPRIGMPVFGLGLLDTMKESDILAYSDVDDIDEDEISGKPNWVFDKEKYDYCSDTSNNFSCENNPPLSLGRYGWKANTPTVAHQGLGAFRGDMGITNPLFKTESVAGTDLMQRYKEFAGSSFVTYDDTKSDADLDADLAFSQAIVFYTETLSVPARRDTTDSDVKDGAVLFDKIGCTKCHAKGSKERLAQGLDGFLTGNKSGSYSRKQFRNPYLNADNEDTNSKIDVLENQIIYPFTDGLLHDMGDALADGRKDGDANGNEWKTRPLWGIGLTQKVLTTAGFLHDGRARTLEEAIIWHGGEALDIKLHFMNLDKTDRDKIIKFLEDL